MKELVVISGKGGTGKTSIIACFTALANNKITVDCDVDAADLFLVLNPTVELQTDFNCGKKASIITDLCIKCGKCQQICRFDAIFDNFIIDEILCEGCGACFYQCSSNAIKLETSKSGEWYSSSTRFGQLIHAKLGVAEENSGKLVTEIKNYARKYAKENNLDLILVDGSPGIGCPVIASISGATIVLIVTEPTLSGIHDAKRVYELTKHFKIPTCFCINKFDINIDLSKELENFCKDNKIDLLGKIPYCKDFTNAQIKGLTLVEYSNNNILEEVKSMWNKLENKISENKNVK